MLEKDLEAKLVKTVKELGGECLKFTSPSNTGVPDRVVLLRGTVCFVEMKKPEGKYSAKQDYWRDRLKELHVNYRRISNEQELDEAVRDFEKSVTLASLLLQCTRQIEEVYKDEV